MQTKKCSNHECQQENVLSAKFCKKCGAPFAQHSEEVHNSSPIQRNSLDIQLDSKTTNDQQTSQVQAQHKSTETNAKRGVISGQGSKKKLFITVGTLISIVGISILAIFLLWGKKDFVKQIEAIDEQQDIDGFLELVTVPQGADENLEPFKALLNDYLLEFTWQILNGLEHATEDMDLIPIYIDNVHIASVVKEDGGLFSEDYSLQLQAYELYAHHDEGAAKLELNGESVKVTDSRLIGTYIPGMYEYTASRATDASDVTYTETFAHPMELEQTNLYLYFETKKLTALSDYVETIIYVDGEPQEEKVGEDLVLNLELPASVPSTLSATLTVDDIKYDSDQTYQSTDPIDEFYFTFSEYEKLYAIEEFMHEDYVRDYFKYYREAFEVALAEANFDFVEAYYAPNEQITADYKKFVDDHQNFEEYSYNFIENKINNVERIDRETIQVTSTEIFEFTMEPDGTYYYEREKLYTMVINEETNTLEIVAIEILDTLKEKR